MSDFTRFLMISEMCCVNGLVVAPLTPMDLGLFLGLFFWTDSGNSDRLMNPSMVDIQLFPAMELFPTVVNITEDLSVRLHVGLEVG